MSGWTFVGICCLVAAAFYWLGAAVERHLAAISRITRDDRFAARHRIDPDSYAGCGDWADRKDVA